MSDTFLSEGGHEWPRRYTPAEVTLLANSLGRTEIDPIALENIQVEVVGYQWATKSDEGVFNRTNKERRQQLKEILKLLGKSPDEEIKAALNELDGPTAQRLVPFNLADRKRFARSVMRVIDEIPDRGRDPKRARRQYIGDLYPIFYHLTGQRPGRRVHDEEYGPFRDFVRAALNPFNRAQGYPFNAAQGCEADIKAVLRSKSNRSRAGEKNAVVSKS